MTTLCLCELTEADLRVLAGSEPSRTLSLRGAPSGDPRRAHAAPPASDSAAAAGARAPSRIAWPIQDAPCAVVS